MINPPFQYTTTDPVFAVNGGSPSITALPPFQYTSIKPVFVVNPGNTNVYTKAEVDQKDADTLQAAKDYTDASLRLDQPVSIFYSLMVNDNLTTTAKAYVIPKVLRRTSLKGLPVSSYTWANPQVTANLATSLADQSFVHLMNNTFDTVRDANYPYHNPYFASAREHQILFKKMVTVAEYDTSNIPRDFLTELGWPAIEFLESTPHPRFKLSVVNMKLSKWRMMYKRYWALGDTFIVDNKVEYSWSNVETSKFLVIDTPGVYIRRYDESGIVYHIIVPYWPTDTNLEQTMYRATAVTVVVNDYTLVHRLVGVPIRTSSLILRSIYGRAIDDYNDNKPHVNIYVPTYDKIGQWQFYQPSAVTGSSPAYAPNAVISLGEYDISNYL